jgi:hypothetical protein
MVVPSRGRQCWLVTLWDGNVDVWRVDDPTARYEFRVPILPLDRSEHP